jgi:hypothetical protein
MALSGVKKAENKRRTREEPEKPGKESDGFHAEQQSCP